MVITDEAEEQRGEIQLGVEALQATGVPRGKRMPEAVPSACWHVASAGLPRRRSVERELDVLQAEAAAGVARTAVELDRHRRRRRPQLDVGVRHVGALNVGIATNDSNGTTAKRFGSIAVGSAQTAEPTDQNLEVRSGYAGNRRQTLLLTHSRQLPSRRGRATRRVEQAAALSNLSLKAKLMDVFADFCEASVRP
ncbi:hypothetical protein GUJ93_ZPchr0001g31643 [Zizania palustris]|uniref:Uncharacterized protein n=1 Tax=Zizania palustris TaxID=103762 RepID=A0A8J5SHI7_ZIZPA|nr:hypothetical protein GUJ93_ZPchr0001g31643 [Zizania palustris]